MAQIAPGYHDRGFSNHIIDDLTLRIIQHVDGVRASDSVEFDTDDQLICSKHFVPFGNRCCRNASQRRKRRRQHLCFRHETGNARLLLGGKRLTGGVLLLRTASDKHDDCDDKHQKKNPEPANVQVTNSRGGMVVEFDSVQSNSGLSLRDNEEYVRHSNKKNQVNRNCLCCWQQLNIEIDSGSGLFKIARQQPASPSSRATVRGNLRLVCR